MYPTCSLRTIKASFNHSVTAQPFFFRYVARPISFYFTYLVLRLRMTANQATLTGLLLGVIGSIFFIKGIQAYLVWGVVCYFLFLIFDFVDGNIARVTNSATYWGKFLDGIVDTFIEVLLPFSVAIGLYFMDHDVFFLIAGMAVSIALSFASFVINRASFFNRWLKMDEIEKQMPFSKFKSPQDVNPLRTSLKKIGNFLTDVKIIILIVAVVVGMTEPLFIALLLSIAIWATAVIMITIINAAEQLNVHRISKWDSRLKKE